MSSVDNEQELWLKLFKARTEEELEAIEALGVPVMGRAIGAYRHITAAKEFKELERMRSRARHNEAAALRYARMQGAEDEREKWRSANEKQTVLIAEQTAAIAEQAAAIEQLRAQLQERR